MPAEDKVHGPIRSALVKSGWRITSEPFVMELEGDFLYADIGAERLAGEQAVQAIVVEVKSFGHRSIILRWRRRWGSTSCTGAS